jgi:hypothetical protein
VLPSTLAAALPVAAVLYQSIRYCGPFPSQLPADLESADGFAKTAETVSHFDRRVSSRSPAHPANVRADSRAVILIRAFYPNLQSLSGFRTRHEAALGRRRSIIVLSDLFPSREFLLNISQVSC